LPLAQTLRTTNETKLFITDFSKTPDAAQWREKREQARAGSRRYCLDRLAGAFAEHGVNDPSTLAQVALDALFDWRHIETGNPCECGCHPRVGNKCLHTGGSDCGCTKTAEQRRHDWARWNADRAEFWSSPEGQQIVEHDAAQEADLQSWLATQSGVVLSSHGGYAPEQWEGTVDGHSFYFRERWGNWSLELDLRPNGSFGRAITGVDANGEIETEEFEHRSGDVIAEGAIGTDGYGDNPLQRAQFIIDMIRIYLARQTCAHLSADLSVIGDILDDELRWCPACGARLNIGTDR
jgi:hypothetical protein